MANIVWEGDVSGDWSVAGNWVGGVAPVNGDSVTIPATTTQAITSGLNQSAVTIVNLIVEEGAPAVGTRTLSAITYLQIGISGYVRFSGAGTSYIDIGSSAVPFQVDSTVVPATGLRGLYIKGSAISTLSLNGAAYVGLAWNFGETATATIIRCANASSSLWTGTGVTNTTTHAIDGNHVFHHSGTTMNGFNGTVITRAAATWTTINWYGEDGILYPQSTGTISTMNIFGGTVDSLNCGIARTVTNLKLDPGGTLRHDPAYFTISNWTAPTTAIDYVTARP